MDLPSLSDSNTRLLQELQEYDNLYSEYYIWGVYSYDKLQAKGNISFVTVT